MTDKPKHPTHASDNLFSSPVMLITLLFLLVSGIMLAGGVGANKPAYAAPQSVPLDTLTSCVGTPQRLFIDWINYGKPNATTELYAECADGRIVNLSNSPGRENSPQVSPTGDWIAYDRADKGPAQVWVMRIDGSDQRQITLDVIGANLVRWLSDTQFEYIRKTIDSCTLYNNNINGDFEVLVGDCK